MKSVAFFAIVALAVTVAYGKPAEDKYTDKYDGIDYKQIAGNERLLKQYMECVLEKEGAKCAPEGTLLKEKIPDALATECAKCTEKQKEGTEWLLKYLSANKPDYWKELVEKYDKTGEYRKKYEVKAKEEGIKV